MDETLEFTEAALDTEKEDIVFDTLKFSRLVSDVEAHILIEPLPALILNVVINNSGIVSN
jgi:hypothetical protein